MCDHLVFIRFIILLLLGCYAHNVSERCGKVFCVRPLIGLFFVGELIAARLSCTYLEVVLHLGKLLEKISCSSGQMLYLMDKNQSGWLLFLDQTHYLQKHTCSRPCKNVSLVKIQTFWEAFLFHVSLEFLNFWCGNNDMTLKLSYQSWWNWFIIHAWTTLLLHFFYFLILNEFLCVTGVLFFRLWLIFILQTQKLITFESVLLPQNHFA